MLSQVLGMLFGPKDDQSGLSYADQATFPNGELNDYSMPKKRGRPPSIDRTTQLIMGNRLGISLSDLEHPENGIEMSNTDNFPKRKRGRPPKSSTGVSSSYCKKPQNRNDLKRNSSSGDLNLDSAYGMKNFGSVRRSRRYKPPEQTKEMLVLLTDDDPITKFGIPATEINEFKLCMEDIIDIEDEDKDGHHDPVPVASVVFTPGVYEIENYDILYGKLSECYQYDSTSLSKPSKFSIASIAANQPFTVLPPLGTNIPGFHYNQYEADSDDEEFIESMNNFITREPVQLAIRLNNDKFQRMMAIMEREYQSSKHLNPLVIESMRLESECEKFINESLKSLPWINAFVDSLSESGEMTAATEELIAIANENPLKHPGLSINPVHYDDNNTSNAFSAIPMSSRSDTSAHTEYSVFPSLYEKREESSKISLQSANQIRAAFINTDIFELLFDIYTLENGHPLVSLDSSINFLLSEEPQIVAIRNILVKIFDYYVDKRSKIRVSPLRCFHDFMMENWSRQSAMIPIGPKDLNSVDIANEETRLMALLKDLDRSRLITDRIRRREKLKRDIIRLSSENLANKTLASSRRFQKEDDNSEDMDFTLESVVYIISNPEPQPTPQETQPVATAAVAKRSRGRSLDTTTAQTTEIVSPFVPAQAISEESQLPKQPPRLPHYRRTSRQSSFSNWSLDEDRLLLLGVAACGLGRWTEIREDFNLSYRSSAQMNQRFFRLTKKRKLLVDGDPTVTENVAVEPTEQEHDESMPANNGDSFNSRVARNDLSPVLVTLLDSFNEDDVWNKIALRYLLDMHQHERRSGRPVKHPIHIPIPSEYQHRGFLKYKHLQARRPSSPSFRLPSNDASEHEGVNDLSSGSAATTTSPCPSISCDMSEASHMSDAWKSNEIDSTKKAIHPNRKSSRLNPEAAEIVVCNENDLIDSPSSQETKKQKESPSSGKDTPKRQAVLNSFQK